MTGKLSNEAQEALFKKMLTLLKGVIFFCFFLFSMTAFSQTHTQVKGRVRDANTNEPLPFANVSLKKNQAGCATQENGTFGMKAHLSAADTLVIAHIGYEAYKCLIKPGDKKEYEIKLRSLEINMPSVTISAKREKYTKKGNPAVELMEMAIHKKEENRLTRNDYYQYHQHEILQVAVNNFTDTAGLFNKFLKWFDFSARYVDLSDLNSKPILPIFISENICNVSYEKATNSKKVKTVARKGVEFHKMMDMEGLESLIRQTFKDIDIYDNSIRIFGVPFTSPFSSMATSYYKFFISDTVLFKGDSCIQLIFFPRNAMDIGFSGKLFLIKDTASLAVKKLELRLPPRAGMNWVDELFIKQEFQNIEGNWCLIEDQSIADMSAVSQDFMSMHIRQSSGYRDYTFNQPPPPDTLTKKEEEAGFFSNFQKKDEQNWDSLRIRPLTKLESNTYIMYDELHKSAKYKVMSNGLIALMTGYVPLGKFDVGYWNSLLSYNDIEGMRARIGARTNTLFHPQIFFDGYIAYGFTDEQLKYQLGATYSFNKKKFFVKEYPRNSISITYQEDNKIPGESNTLFGNTYDKFWFSLRTTPLTKMTFDKHFGIVYEKDFAESFMKGLSLVSSFHYVKEKALGEMNFNTTNELQTSFVNSQFGLSLEYTPNNRFFQMGNKRRQIDNSSPVFGLDYTLGVKDFLKADYTFHKLEFRASKNTPFPIFGSLEVEMNAGKVWNTVPYPLLFTPEGNQSFFSIVNSFNLMNFMEFIADEYVDLRVFYRGSGFIFNRIPFVNKLNIRGVVIGKMVWGHLSSANNPKNNPDQMLFPTNEEDENTIYTFDKLPYIEASVGIYNIFNILQVDFIKRFTYLNNPNALSWGIRTSVFFGF